MSVMSRCVAALAVCAAVACDSSSGPGADGVLIVGNSTFGANLDTDGYVITIDGGEGRRLVVNGGDYWTLAPGTHSVGLGDLQGNCATEEANGASTGPNPQNVTVASRDTALVWFAVVCN